MKEDYLINQLQILLGVQGDMLKRMQVHLYIIVPFYKK